MTDKELNALLYSVYQKWDYLLIATHRWGNFPRKSRVSFNYKSTTLYILQPLEAAKSLPQRLMYPIMYPYYVLIVESPLSHNRSCFFTVV